MQERVHGSKIVKRAASKAQLTLTIFSWKESDRQMKIPLFLILITRENIERSIRTAYHVACDEWPYSNYLAFVNLQKCD